MARRTRTRAIGPRIGVRWCRADASSDGSQAAEDADGPGRDKPAVPPRLPPGPAAAARPATADGRGAAAAPAQEFRRLALGRDARRELAAHLVDLARVGCRFAHEQTGDGADMVGEIGLDVLQQGSFRGRQSRRQGCGRDLPGHDRGVGRHPGN